MSDADDRMEAEPTDEPVAEEPARRRWRDDPLSVFLAVAALLLGLMYVLEQSALDSVQEAAARAHRLGAGELDLDGCTVGSASTAGSVLVVACKSTAEEAARRAAERSPTISEFRSIVFVGSDVQLECPVTPPNWPDACQRRERPTRAEIAEAEPG